MKKLTALILTLVMLVSMTAIVPVNAASNVPVVTPSVTEIEVEPGQTVVVNFAHNDDLDYWSTTFELQFNETVYLEKAARIKPFDGSKYSSYFDEEEEETYTHYNAGAKTFIAKEMVCYMLECPDPTKNMTEEMRKYHTDYSASKYQVATFLVDPNAQPGTYYVTYIANFCTNKSVDLPTQTGTIAFIVPGDEDEIIVDDKNIKTGGYSLRTSGDFGFRFVSEISNYGEDVTYGTLVIPTNKLEGELTVNTTDVADVVAENFMSEAGAATKQFNATLIDIAGNKNAIDREYTVRAYVKDGDTVKYGATATYNIKALIENAITAEADATIKAYYESILASIA